MSDAHFSKGTELSECLGTALGCRGVLAFKCLRSEASITLPNCTVEHAYSSRRSVHMRHKTQLWLHMEYHIPHTYLLTHSSQHLLYMKFQAFFKDFPSTILAIFQMYSGAFSFKKIFLLGFRCRVMLMGAVNNQSQKFTELITIIKLHDPFSVSWVAISASKSAKKIRLKNVPGVQLKFQGFSRRLKTLWRSDTTKEYYSQIYLLSE